MFHCHMCSEPFSKSSTLIDHYKNVHKCNNASRFVCKKSDCNRTYQNLFSFKKHLERHTNETKQSKNLVADQLRQITDNTENKDNESRMIEINKTFYRAKSSLEDSIEKAARSYIINLHTKSITREDIQYIVESTAEFIKSSLIGELKNCLSNTDSIPNEHKFAVDKMFSVFEKSFDKFDTEYKRLKYFEESGYYIDPEPYVIGQIDVSKFINGTFVLTQVNVYGQFVSLRKTLLKLFGIPTFLQTIIEYMHTLISDTQNISHFLQADLYKPYRKDFPKKIVLPIMLYFDEFETNDALGGHTGIHKQGAVYSSLLCLPPEFASKLDNIFLTLLFNDIDRKDWGNAAAFQPLINELKEMESIPIIVTESGVEIYVRCMLIIGDNLGVHEILGFVQSFAANYPCRICIMPKEDLKVCCEEKIDLLRTIESYKKDVEKQDVSTTGINNDCIFNVLDSYHCITNISCDIMHDVYEGVCRYIMCNLILRYVDEKKYFNIKELNDRIGSFNFGMIESGNRPPFLTKEKLKRNTLGFSASETVTFVKHFGLIIGHRIPEDDDYWNIYITLCKVINLLHKRCFTVDDTNTLQVLVSQMNKMYIDYFGDTLKFKNHFMNHYARIMRLIGQLKNVSCMRFEAKHKESKVRAHLTTCRINLPRTLSVNHQLKVCARLLNETALKDKIIVGSKDNHKFDKMPYFIEYRDLLSESNLVNLIEIKNILYKPKMVLTIGINLDLPIFGYIEKIITIKEKVSFLVKVLKTEELCAHVQAYKVEVNTQQWQVIQYDELCNKFPSEVLYTAKADSFVILRE